MGRRRSREFKKNSDIIDIEEARKQRQERRKRQETEERFAGNKGGRISRRKRFRFLYAVIILAVAVILGLSVYNIISLNVEKRVILNEQHELQKKKDALKKELSELNSPEYIRQQAREQLKLIMPGEKLFIMSKDKDKQE